jgi:L-arabinose isomerase
MKITQSKGCIGFIPVMAKLYEKLLPDLKADLQNFSNLIGTELSRQGVQFEVSNVACTHHEVQKAVRQFEDMNVDLLIIGHVSYCASGEILPSLKKCSLPVVLWPAQPMLKLVGRDYDVQTVFMNHGVHGTQDLANMLRRSVRPFGLLHGHYRQSGFVEELLSWANAGRTVRSMKQSHPMIFGGHFEQMLDLQIDRETFLSRFGASAKTISLADFQKERKAISKKEIQTLCDAYRSEFKIDQKVTSQLLEKTARNEAVLRRILQKSQCRAIGINFQSLCNAAGIEDGLHVAVSRLMTEGVGYGGEGDWVTAMLGCGLQAATDEASFSEIFSVGYQDNRLVARHWGEGNYKLARQKPALRCSQFTDQRKADFCVLDFEFKPGKVTMVNLNATPDGQGQLITLTGSIEKEQLPAVDGPRGIFRPQCKDIRELLDDYGYHGGSHHLVLVRGDAQNLIGKIARLTGWTWEKL